MNLDRLRKRVRQYIDQVRIIYFTVYVLQANGNLRSTKRTESLDLSLYSHNHNSNQGLNRVSPFYSNSTKVHCFGLTRQLLFLMVSETCFFAFSLINVALQISVQRQKASKQYKCFGSKLVLFSVISYFPLWHSSSFLSSINCSWLTLAVL